MLRRNGGEKKNKARAYLGAKVDVESALPLHLRLQVGQLRDRHVDVAAADVRRVPEVRGHADHAAVYPEPLVRPTAVSPVVPRRPWRQAARKTLYPELVVAGHLSLSFSYFAPWDRDGSSIAGKEAWSFRVFFVEQLSMNDDPRDVRSASGLRLQAQTSRR